MKRLFLILFFLISELPIVAQTASSNITAVITVTNQVTNGYAIQINSGPSRMFTNYVSNPANQIQQTNSMLQSATNLWLALSSYPNVSPFVGALMTNTNVIILTSINGQGLTVTTNSTANPGLNATNNWCSIQLYTNFFTNVTGVRVPTNAVGITEQSNVAYGLFQYLNSPYMTNTSVASGAVNSTLSQWSNFVNAASLAALSNHVGLIATNATNYASNLYVLSTNYTWIEATNSTNFTLQIALLTSNYAFTLEQQFGVVYSNVFAPISSLAPWQTGLNVNLTNEAGKSRFYGQDNGGSIGGYTSILHSDGTTKILYNDGSPGNTILYDVEANPRIQIQEPGSTHSNTIIWGGADSGLTIGGLQGTTFTDRPLVLQSNICPSVAMGTFTNYVGQAQNGDTSADVVDGFNIPANAMTNNGDRIIRTVSATFGVNSTSTKEVQIYWNSTLILDSAAQLPTGSASYDMECEITRVSSSVAICRAHGFGVNVPTKTFSLVSSVSTTFSSAITNYIVIQSTGTGSAADQITITSDNTVLAPSALWKNMP